MELNCETFAQARELVEEKMSRYADVRFYAYRETASKNNLQLVEFSYLHQPIGKTPETVEVKIEYGPGNTVNAYLFDMYFELVELDYGLTRKTKEQKKEKKGDNWDRGLNLIQDKLGM